MQRRLRDVQRGDSTAAALTQPLDLLAVEAAGIEAKVFCVHVCLDSPVKERHEVALWAHLVVRQSSKSTFG